MTPDVTTLILPGLWSSGPEHWQSYWERMDPSCQRVEQSDWESPRCADWMKELSRALEGADGDVVLVAHSAGCALVAHWASTAESRLVARVRGALLVAPADPERPSFPTGPTGFAPVPRVRLPFPSTVVASRNDEYVTLAQTKAYADAWGSTWVDAGDVGHINGLSGLGAWPAGYALLAALRATSA